MLNIAKSRAAQDQDETYLCLILMLHSWCIAPQRADAIMARLAGWHIHREPSNTLIRYTWWGIAQRADIFSSSSIPPLFPAGRLIGFATTRYRGLVSSSIFHPHIYFTLHWHQGQRIVLFVPPSLEVKARKCLLCEANKCHLGLVLVGHLLPSHVTLSACQCLLLPIWQTTTGLLPHLTTATVFVGSQTSKSCSFCRNTKNFPK